MSVFLKPEESFFMLDRRRFLAVCSQLGLTSTLLPGVLWGMAEPQGKVTKEMIQCAAEVADVPLPEGYQQAMVDGLNENKHNYEEIYKLHIPNSVAPAFIFDPVLTGENYDKTKRPMRISAAPALNITGSPRNLDEV